MDLRIWAVSTFKMFKLTKPALAIICGVFVYGYPATAADQVCSEIEVLVLQEGDLYDEVVYGQRSAGERLSLGANECFFFPVGPRLQNGGKVSGDQEATLFNKGERYSEIGSIRNPGQQIKWPLLPVSNGAFTIKIFLEVGKDAAGSQWIVRCGDIEKQFVSVESDGRSPQPGSFSGRITKSGLNKQAVQFLTFELLEPSKPGLEAAVIHRLEIEGEGMNGAYVLRSRWRPQAVHTRFSNTRQRDFGLGLSAWIVEVKPHFDFAGDPFQFYAPVTTEFGYYGSTFMLTDESTPNLFMAKPMNFSLWSYKRGASEPPIGQLSHLLAIGDPHRMFGGYHHEGTGVKPRGDLPEIEGQRLESLILGMRFDPPDPTDLYPYRTYHAYFFDPKTRAWKLYASGRKFTDDPWKYGGLREPGAFVEVPGRVASQRTHQSLRSASYRGWLLDTEGDWHAIDSISGPTKVGEIAPKRWEVDNEGWFRLSTGGMIYRRFKTRDNGATHSSPFALPDYMQAEALNGFMEYPVSLSMFDVKRQADGSLVVDFELKGTKDAVEVVLHFGPRDGLTLIFEDNDRASKWEGSVSSNFAAGKHRWTVCPPRGESFPEKGFCRLLANTEQGRFWALESSKWK